MNNIRKKKLLAYLYQTEEKETLLSEIYTKLLFVLDRKICFNNCNLNKAVREYNFKKAKQVISNFIDENAHYKIAIKKVFAKIDFNSIVEEILWGYILFITPNINKSTGADVFLDKRSVCYSKNSIIDLL